MERLEQILNKDKRAIISQLPKEEQEIAEELFRKKVERYEVEGHTKNDSLYRGVRYLVLVYRNVLK